MMPELQVGKLAEKVFSFKLALSRVERELLMVFAVMDKDLMIGQDEICKQLGIAKKSFHLAVQSLKLRGYLLQETWLDERNRKRQHYQLASHPDLFEVETDEESVSWETGKPIVTVSMETDSKTIEIISPVDQDRTEVEALTRGEIVEQARRIERLFAGRTGYIDCVSLNREVRQFLTDRGRDEYSYFASWLLESSRNWRKLTVGDFPEIVARWDQETRKLPESSKAGSMEPPYPDKVAT